MKAWHFVFSSLRLFMVVAVLAILSGGGILLYSYVVHKPLGQLLSFSQPIPSNKAVLAASASPASRLVGLTYNIPVNFNNTVKMNKGLTVNGTTTVNGNLIVNGESISLGGETFTASSFHQTLTPGEGISISKDASPVIANTGVLTVQGTAGAVVFTGGTGIGIDGLALSNTDPGSAQDIFKTITVGGTSLAAGSNTDSLTFAAGNGLAASIDTNTKKITFSQNLLSGLSTNGLLYASGDSAATSLVPGTTGFILQSNGSGAGPTWIDPTTIASKTIAFSALTSGTNTTADMIVGAGASLTYSGGISTSGVINANQLLGGTWAAPGAIGATTANSGNFTSLTAGGTITFSGLSTGILHANNLGVLSSSALNLNSADITGILQIANGGTGGTTSATARANLGAAASGTNSDITTLSGLTTALSIGEGGTGVTGTPTNGQLLIGNGSGYTIANLTGTANQVIVTNSAGGITLSTPQNINTGASPTFAGETLGSSSAQGGLVLGNTSGNLVTVKSSNSTTTPYTFLLPTSGGTSNYILKTDGTGVSTWTDVNSLVTNAWQLNSGAVAPANITNDLLIGGTATTSAKFQVVAGTGTITSNGNIVLTNATSSIGTAVKGQWTLNGNTFTYRRQITITNTSGSNTIPVNYEVTFSPTGSALSDICSNSQSNSNDIRLSFNNTELSENITNGCTSSLSIKFLIQATIAASGSSNAYFIYYGNSTLGTAGTSYTNANVQIDSMDNAASWTSSDSTNSALSQETTIKQEGTGSLKAIVTTPPATDFGGWSTTGQAQYPTNNQLTTSVTVTVGGTTYIYTAGGYVGAVAQSSLYRSTVDSSGNVGAWSTTGQGQLPIGIGYGSMTTATYAGTNYLYLIGDTTDVYRAQISTTGNVGAWSTTGQGQIPLVTQGNPTSSLVSIGGTNYLYFLDATHLVYKAQIDTSGNIGAWSTSGQGQFANSRTTTTTIAAAVNGTNYIYSIGGNGVTTSVVYKAQIDTSGNIGTWSTSGQTQYPGSAVFAPTTLTATFGGTTYLYAIGGSGFGNSWKSQLDSNGNVGTWATTAQSALPSTLSLHSSVLVTKGANQYAYLIAPNNTKVFMSPLVVLNPPTYTVTRTISSTDLSTFGGIQFDVYSSVAGSFMSFQLSNDGGSTWQTFPFTITTPNAWQIVTLDTSGLLSSQKNTVTKIRFSITAPTGPTLYFDDIEATPIGSNVTTPSLASGLAVFGANNLSLNAQGSGVINFNYDPTNSQAGSGGLALYNGTATSLFSVDGSGNASQSGSLSMNGTNGSKLNLLNGSNFTIQTSVGGDAGLNTKLILTNAGNLGIGTAAPGSTTLDVRSILGTQSIASISGATSFAGLVVDNSGRGDIFTASTAGRTRFVIAQNGNVGIGTAAPGSTTLDVRSILGTQSIASISGATSFAGLVVDNSGRGDIFTASTAGRTRFVINANGNLGLNTNLPNSLLDVRGTGGLSTISGTVSVASISAKSSFAALVVDNSGVGDIFTASSSGLSRFSVTQNGNVLIGNSALSTTATDGFLYIDTSVGSPSGTPTAYTGSVAMEYDTTDNKLCFYNAAWKCDSSFADYAEWAPAKGAASGDIVTITNEKNPVEDATAPFMLGKSTTPYDSKMVGIISKYAEEANMANGYKKSDDYHAVALAGRVPLNVSTINGAIHAGDYMTSSSIPGVAMKATHAGGMIGKALEDYTNIDTQAVGQILTFVNISWADPSVVFAADGSLSVNGQQVVSSIGPVAHVTDTVSLSTTNTHFNAIDAEISTLQNQVASLSGTVEKLSLQNMTGTSSGLLDTTTLKDLQTRVSLLESTQGVLGSSTQTADTTIGKGLTVLGKTLLTDVGITGKITMGQLAIDGLDMSTGTPAATINTLSAPLKLQSLASAGIDFENGKVTIDTEGNITVNGDISAKSIHTDTIDTGSLTVKNSGSDSASVGEATLPAGQTKIDIKTTRVTELSKIFTSLETLIDIPLVITHKDVAKSFTIEIVRPLTKDIKFGWWLIN